MKRCAIAASLVIATAAFASPVAASGSRGIFDTAPDRPVLRVGLEIDDPGTPGSTGSGGRRPTVVYRLIPHSSVETGAPGFEHYCAAPPTDPAGDPSELVPGWWHSLVAIDTATGAQLSSQVVCVPFTDDGSAPTAGVVPDPPTLAEVWDAVALPGPRPGTSPAAEGVTGLPTWFWVEGPAEVAVSVSLRGFTVTGTARVVEWSVDTGEGPVARAAHPGTPDAPALTHTFETTGTRQVAVGTAWTAAVTMTGPGLPAAVPVDLGRATVTSTFTYPVGEVRAVLVD